MRPNEFAAQLNMSLMNGWGIVRTIVDICLKHPDGKYVLIKDPNKVRQLSTPIRKSTNQIHAHDQPVIRLYAVPPDAFAKEEDLEDENAYDEDAE